MARKITQEELNKILDKHKKWLNNEPGGECADLHYSDLRGCNFCGSNLSGCNFRDSDLRYSDLRGCNLSYSDLRHCNLRYSDLRGCNLDFSCLPLWCGSLSAHFDDRQIVQIIYHAVKAGLESPNVSDEVKTELRKVAGLANRFHRAEECGRIEE